MALMKEKTKHHFNFLSLVKLRTVTEIPLQWWVYLFHKICKTCQFVFRKLLIRASLLRNERKKVSSLIQLLKFWFESKGQRDMCYSLFLCHSIKSTFWLKSNFHLEIQIFMTSFIMILYSFVQRMESLIVIVMSTVVDDSEYLH